MAEESVPCSLLSALPSTAQVISQEERRTVAFHESGHAVVSWFLEYAEPLLKVPVRTPPPRRAKHPLSFLPPPPARCIAPILARWGLFGSGRTAPAGAPSSEGPVLLLPWAPPAARAQVSIVPRGTSVLGFAQYLPNENLLLTKEQLLDRLCALLGGRAAEQVRWLLSRLAFGCRVLRVVDVMCAGGARRRAGALAPRVWCTLGVCVRGGGLTRGGGAAQ